MATALPDTQNLERPKIGLQIYLILCAGLIIAFAGFKYTNNLVEGLVEQRTQNELKLISSKIQDQFQTANATLNGLTAFLKSSKNLTAETFQTFSSQIASAQKTTGLLALVYAPVIQEADKSAFEQKLSAELNETIRVKPEGPRGTYTPIAYAHLTNGSKAMAIGFDLQSESVRALTLLSATATGEVAVSSTYQFVGNRRFGFIMARSIEEPKNGALVIPRDISAFAIGAFSANDFVDSLDLGKASKGEFALIDLDETSNMLFSSDGFAEYVIDKDRHVETHVSFGGKAWKIVLKPAPIGAYLSLPERFAPAVVLTALISLSILLSLLLKILLHRKNHAEILAHQMSSKYMDESRKAIKARQEVEDSKDMMEVSLRQLKALNSSLNRYAAITAHDLKAPLKRISSMVGFLQDDHAQFLDDDGNELLARIKRSTTKLNGMVSSLLTYSSSKYDEASSSSFSIDDLLKTTTEGMANEELSSLIKVNYHSDALIHGNRELLAHVFQNLLSNALKFKSSEPLEVSVSFDQVENGDVIIRFADNGIGIAPQHAGKIFDMFTRLHNDSEYEGHGIGLATCQRIIFDHGGTIFLDKEYEKGSCFVIRLPAVQNRKKEQGLVA